MNETMKRPGPRTWLRGFGCHMTERDRRNGRRANWLLFGWMAVFTSVMFAFKHDVLASGPLGYAAIAATTAVGVFAILAFARYIREADELVRKIQLDALAFGFGGGMLMNFTLSLIERMTEDPFDIGDMLLVMVIFYVIGVIVGTRRYR